jgi:hypothetical protein
MNKPPIAVNGLRLIIGLAALLPVLLAGQGQALRWEQRDGYREAALVVKEGGRSGFTLLRPEQSGLLFTNTMSYARSEANQNVMNGCGVAAGDFDGDGLCDLYFAGTDGGNGLFRNLGGWQFTNVTDPVLRCESQASKGVVFADLDGDGQLDLVVNALGGPNAFLLNLGQGRFTNLTAAAGLSAKAGGHSVAVADVDGDGDLDVYFANYGEMSILRSGGQFSTRNQNGRQIVTGRWAKRLRLIGSRLIELGEPDALYLNDGHGRFTPVSWTGGSFLNGDGTPLKSEPMDMGLSVMFRDINGDGAPDLYVCNDFQTPDRIWLNDGRGHFRAMADHAVRATCHFSMGVDFADIDRDGFDDFFVGDMLSASHALRMRQVGATNAPADEVGEVWDRQQVRRNTLNVNRGDGTYADLANFAGVDATDWTWSVVFLDVDLDGFEDLLAVNAHAYDTQDLDMQERAPAAQGMGANRQIGKSLKDFPPLITPNYAFRNGGHRTFTEVGRDWGFNSTNISHGIALGDFDNDGDLDVAVSCLWQPPLLYRNESSAPRVAVRLRGLAPNTRGIGAKILLRDGAVPSQSQEIQAGGRYLSADDAMRTFAAARNRDMTIEVKWRSGQVSVVRGVRADRLYEIEEPAAGRTAPAPSSPGPQMAVSPLFKEINPALGHRHEETGFDEASRQPLLYRSLARLGPGVAWRDLDGDGRDELIIGGNAGQVPAVFKWDGAGRWQPGRPAGWPATLGADVAGLAAWAKADGTRGVLLAPSSYRLGAEGSHALVAWMAPGAGGGASPARAEVVADLGRENFSTGPIAVADNDGDGDLDVFIGGRVIPGRYPEPAPSVLLRNEGDRLEVDKSAQAALQKVGLVSGAVWSDLDSDGTPELILACEWGPVRVLRRAGGQWRDMSGEWGLAALTGWWTGVTTADLDGDGRLDIVAANWGWNSSYHRPTAERPAVMYYGDLDDNGTWDLLETEAEAGRIYPRRNLVALAEFMPWLRLRFATHRAFSTADLSALLEDKLPKARRAEATTLASTIFFNRGGRFEAVPLPDEAQHAPAFAVIATDADGDGMEDVFLSQNCFAVRPDEPRLDAGRGLWLRGEGQGTLRPMSGVAAGVMIYGEQRGAAVSDFDGDGRVDLVVAQNDGATRVYHNEKARPGLRVRLAGPKGNPDGVGAILRLKLRGTNGTERLGPMRELKAGGGYWSQDSLVAVLATPDPASSIEVRWPGGVATSAAVPAGAREILVGADGKSQVVH